MRTTLDLDDGLMRRVKKHAAETGRTLTAIVETALRELLRTERSTSGTRLEWTVVAGGSRPGVDLDDRDALLEHMERGG